MRERITIYAVLVVFLLVSVWYCGVFGFVIVAWLLSMLSGVVAVAGLTVLCLPSLNATGSGMLNTHTCSKRIFRRVGIPNPSFRNDTATTCTYRLLKNILNDTVLPNTKTDNFVRVAKPADSILGFQLELWACLVSTNSQQLCHRQLDVRKDSFIIIQYCRTNVYK